jgi:hypothetical protein
MQKNTNTNTYFRQGTFSRYINLTQVQPQLPRTQTVSLMKLLRPFRGYSSTHGIMGRTVLAFHSTLPLESLDGAFSSSQFTTWF